MDYNGDHIRKWCPELKKVPFEYIHEPWNMPLDVAQEAEVAIEGEYGGEGVYPWPIENARYVGGRADKRRDGNRKRKLGDPDLKSKPRKKRW